MSTKEKKMLEQQQHTQAAAKNAKQPAGNAKRK